LRKKGGTFQKKAGEFVEGEISGGGASRYTNGVSAKERKRGFERNQNKFSKGIWLKTKPRAKGRLPNSPDLRTMGEERYFTKGKGKTVFWVVWEDGRRRQ